MLAHVRQDAEVTRLHDLDGWLEASRASEIPALASFSDGLSRDYAAVRAALNEPWSSGQAKGQINRLKTLKRQMYGRAGFELLRKRVLCAAGSYKVRENRHSGVRSGFLFRLIAMLQIKATVPMIDVDAYASWLLTEKLPEVEV